MTSCGRGIWRWMANALVATTAAVGGLAAAEDWVQLKFDAGHSGDVPQRRVTTPLGLIGAVPLTDSVLAAPVVSGPRVYVLDAAGVLSSIDVETCSVAWRFASPPGVDNCNNVSAPAIAGQFVHFGTSAGQYYVLDKETGAVVRQIACGEPIFSAPVVSAGRVYFATLGARVYALQPDGSVCWVWDFVVSELGFTGDRWSGQAWRQHRAGKVTRFDQFLCSRNMAATDRMLVIPAGGTVVWLEDVGDRAARRAVDITGFAVEPRSPTPTLAMSVSPQGTVYRQWHWLDNQGQVDRLDLREGQVQRDVVRGTETSTRGGLLSFASVSIRGQDVYRTRPEQGWGLCRHAPAAPAPAVLAGCPSIAAPILLQQTAVYGDLHGRLHVVPLTGGATWSYQTPFGKCISAPAAICDGRIYFGCEDGYLYILGPDGRAAPPTQDLGLAAIRHPLEGEWADARFDRFTSFHDWSNTNADRQGLQPPLKLSWVRRFEGTAKHFSTFGGGRMYTHTAEGQVLAVEAASGRLLWRVYYPGVHICYTAPLYYRERLLVPQAGLTRCRLRCLDAATGALQWEAPFSGSPSWNRQAPPIVQDRLVFYCFGTGRYDPEAPREPGTKPMKWLFGHQNNARFPAHHRPLLRAFDLADGRTVWERDFSAYGAGGDESGLCLLDGTLYYTCFFGHSPARRGAPAARGITAAITPATGTIRWLTTDYSMNGGCAISAADGRLYLGGYNPVDGTEHRYVWCLDARDGSLIWRSDPLLGAIQVVTVGSDWLFAHAQYQNGYLLDKKTGRILATLTEGYRCTRFTLSEPYLIGSNMDLFDLTRPADIRLVASGPRVDASECIGGVVSNGRLFYTAHGAGVQLSLCGRTAADAAVAPPCPNH
ncbi:MAG: hypothetical protein A2W31_07140 [Planctomycetes bacterium RBG_16_64_10]|nr:MAG: hypothetical protein A2W31_07140 [Planctomycetes bacterium RBG_16_64_10]